jgi:hypothetical protein
MPAEQHRTDAERIDGLKQIEFTHIAIAAHVARGRVTRLSASKQTLGSSISIPFGSFPRIISSHSGMRPSQCLYYQGR